MVGNGLRSFYLNLYLHLQFLKHSKTYVTSFSRNQVTQYLTTTMRYDKQMVVRRRYFRILTFFKDRMLLVHNLDVVEKGELPVIVLTTTPLA